MLRGAGFEHFKFRRPQPPYVLKGEAVIVHAATHKKLVVCECIDFRFEASLVCGLRNGDFDPIVALATVFSQNIVAALQVTRGIAIVHLPSRAPRPTHPLTDAFSPHVPK